ncbi:hypothetical protein [Prosthecobacter sp.]
MDKTPSKKPTPPSEIIKALREARQKQLASQGPMTLEAVRRNQATMKPTR